MKHAWGDGTFSCTAAHTQMPKLHGLPATSTFFMANEAPMVEMVSPKVL
eukprot:CAMPEP_0182847114 /NCGR_PEP_ID=MMETSP0006_2-20121128/28270_1 /TAXON_ID=97485 /ORGANISM="Prymnesium parvum, Strain Texoma1" /LENGTH=48 /DNA_ID= /DNA_START= /DNA_END= /DNA_ORIENTATION=